MATGGFSALIEDHSNVNLEYTCTPCWDVNIREEAVKYCPECNSYLCTKCTNQHGQRKAFNSHQLVDTNVTERGHMVAKTTKCTDHPNNASTVYCEDHDMVYCMLCIATDHWTCKNKSIIVQKDRQTAQRKYTVKSKKEINIKMQNDSKTCDISDVCQLQDGTIILADWYNEKVKRLDMNYNIKDHFDLGNYPMAICCTGQNEVAVKMYNSMVQFISVGSSLSKLREIYTGGGDHWGMAYCAGELWVSTENGVNVYSTSGTLLKTIRQDINGRNIFKSTTQHMAVSGETVIVTDNSDGAVYLRKDYTVQRKLRDKSLVNTTGVCVSGNGTVFLSAYGSHNIVMLYGNGKYLKELVAQDAGLKLPHALHYDDKRSCLIVTCYVSDKIMIYDISI